MNLCIVSFQAVLLAVLLVQYHYTNEVEAEKLSRYSDGNWFNSMEKRIEIVQNEEDPEAQVVLENEEAPKSKRKIIKKHKKKIRAKHEHTPHEQQENIPHEKHEKHEHTPHEQQEHTRIPIEKHAHVLIPYEQRLDASVEQDKEYAQKVLRRIHKKREKERTHQRKFVKTSQRESNSSESDEVKKRKPVDIIVHIKMNE